MDRLVIQWRERAEALRDYAPPAATAYEKAAAELEAELNREANEALNLREAAKESGYHEDSLGRLVRQGRVPNVGRPNAPKIRRRDLPKRPGIDEAFMREVAGRKGG